MPKMIVVAVHWREDSSLTPCILSVRFHAFSAENGTIKDDHGVLYLTFPAIKTYAIGACYLHHVD